MTTWLNQIRVSYGELNEMGKASAPANSVRLSGNPGRDGDAVGAAKQNDERWPVESERIVSIPTAATTWRVAGCAVASSGSGHRPSSYATGRRFSGQHRPDSSRNIIALAWLNSSGCRRTAGSVTRYFF